MKKDKFLNVYQFLHDIFLIFLGEGHKVNMIKKFKIFENRDRSEEVLLGQIVFKFDELRTTGFFN